MYARIQIALFICLFTTGISTVSANDNSTWIPKVFFSLFGGVAGAPISGKIVDYETGKPIAGVSVFAHWDKTSWHGSIIGVVAAVEAITDEKGRYVLPEWGPLMSSVSDRDLMEYPQIHLFKFGYHPLTVRERALVISGPREIERMSLNSSWEGKTLELKSVKNQGHEYAKTVSSKMGDLDRVMLKKEGPCYWVHYPKTISAFMTARREFEKNTLGTYLRKYLSDYDELSKRKCNKK